ncbi:MAG TPA: hypothetical protein VFX70_12780 [Mycobacteriales bacterium]|nr:hypothetical protein [Mycobacteriales bacterium]
MTFLQIVELEIDAGRYAEAQALEVEWWTRTEGERTVIRNTWCQDHSDPDHYFTIVEFRSYAEAVRNSELPATHGFALRMEQVARSVRYVDLDVLDTRES